MESLDVFSALDDSRPCYVRMSGVECEAILHPTLSVNQMAKVEMEDGRVRDVPWWKVRMADTSERLDALFGDDDEEE